MLLDRESERRVFDQLLADVRAGESRALVMRGEAGIGKTALLEYVVTHAAGCRVSRAAGVEAEKELAFAALQVICTPMLDRLGRLPAPQQQALSTAFGLSTGSAPDRFLLGMAVLSLFAETARERPLLCVVDDGQWLDRASAQVLAFAARRLVAESVAIIFAVRETPGQAEVPELAGLAELPVTHLPDEHARELLRSAYSGPVDEQVLDRIVAESQGNPLALIELPRGFSATELSAGFGPLSSTALPRWIEESFRRRIEKLSPPVRQVLLVAAAEPLGDPVLLWRAVDRLGIDLDVAALSTAGRDLVEFGATVRFRHPLLRSAVYRAASATDRRSAHQALAHATDPAVDPDRRAWHRAQAVAGPDEDVAAELDRSAERAQSRGGLTAAAAFLERATELTADPRQRGRRALAAAHAKHQAGLPDAALRLLALAEASPLGELQRAHVNLLRARIAFTVLRGRDAPSLLLKAARPLERLDPALARDTYLDALRASWFAAHLTGGADLREVAEAARAAAPASSLGPPDLLLRALAVRFTDGYAAGAPQLTRAVEAFRGPELRGDTELRWLWFASTASADLWADETWDVLTSRLVQLARDSGALATLPMTLTLRSVMLIFAGDLAAGGALLGELEAVTETTGIPEPAYAAQLLAAWQGREESAGPLIEATTSDVERRGEGVGLIAAGWMRALLCNSLGRYGEALAAAQPAVEPQQEMGVVTWSALVELITAAARCRQPELATGAVARLAEMTGASGTDWALGVHAGCRALVTEGAGAERYYRESIERLTRTRIRGQLARCHLHYGEWLRRHDRRIDARNELRTAYELFTTMGMAAFAEQAATELAATGETVRKRSVETAGQLTSQEAQIARLVRDGLSNGEIAGRLFISPRTVEWHLSKIFSKLQVTSRRQLRH